MNLTLPTSTVPELMGNVSDLLSTLSPLATLLIGIIICFWIINYIISIIPVNRFGSSGSLSDTSKNDDSYRQKETLYNMDHKQDRELSDDDFIDD